MTKLACIVLLPVIFLSCAQTKKNKAPDKQRIDNICDQFMQTFLNGKVPDALHILKQNSVITASSIDTLQVRISSQLNSLYSNYGKMISYEFISEHKIKEFIAKRFYILKFDKYYLKFDFTLYDNGTGWTITGFNYNDELIELLY